MCEGVYVERLQHIEGKNNTVACKRNSVRRNMVYCGWWVPWYFRVGSRSSALRRPRLDGVNMVQMGAFIILMYENGVCVLRNYNTSKVQAMLVLAEWTAVIPGACRRQKSEALRLDRNMLKSFKVGYVCVLFC